MTIIILPTAYPNLYNSHSAIYVQDQVRALSHVQGLDIHVLGAVPVSLKDIYRIKKLSFGLKQFFDDDIATTLILFPAIPKLRRFNNFIRYFLNKKLLQHYTKIHGKPDLIHVHNAVAAKAALWYRQTHQTPYCITEHSSAYGRGLLSSHELRSHQHFYRHSQCNIAVSQKLSEVLHHITSEPFQYIPNVIHTDVFKPAAEKKASELFTFVNIAYLNDNKNQVMLIKAFAKLVALHPHVRLCIMGSGPNYDTLHKTVAMLHLHNQVTLYGFATRQEVLEQLQHSDAFVLSSYYETFGVVLVEAMSCGLPTLSTRSGGPESIITHDKLGRLVNPTPESLLEGMQHILQTDYNTEYIRNYAIENFSEKTIGERLLSLYTNVTSPRTTIASFVFNPFTHDSRVLKEAVTLHNAGYAVTVVAHGDKGLKKNDSLHGISITRLTYLDRSITQNKLLKLWIYLKYLWFATAYGKQFDVLHCHDLNTLPIGVFVKLFFNTKVKVVYDAHEYETEVNTLHGMQKKIAKFMEGALIRYADSVITVSDAIANEYQRLYHIPKPDLVLNVPVYQEIQKQNLFRETLNISEEKTIFLYQGNLSHGRGVEILLETFQNLKQHHLVIVFMGYGSLEEPIKKAAATYESIYFHDAVSPDALLAYTSSADFGISTIEDSCLSYRYCLPNKMFEYLMADLPVIVSNLPEMKRIVETHHVGVVAQSNTPEGLEAAIVEALKLDYTRLKENIQPVKQIYHWGVQEQKLLALYKDLHL